MALRSYQETLSAAIDSGVITLERLVRSDVAVDHPLDVEQLRDRWKPGSPLYRAGPAAWPGQRW